MNDNKGFQVILIRYCWSNSTGSKLLKQKLYGAESLEVNKGELNGLKKDSEAVQIMWLRYE